MILTEQEAQKKYCLKMTGSKCTASECMAWRWAGYHAVPSDTVPNQDEAHGFCGLASTPVQP